MNSRIFYRGPSQLDGAPILGVLSGLEHPTTNSKTGDMLQTWILREDVPPPEAVRLGLDRSVCGDCALRGDGNGIGRACYVQVKWAPLAVWKYARRELDLDIVFRRKEIEGRFLRMGTYGDPAAIPLATWRKFLTVAAGHTGYTHQWRDRRFLDYRGVCMASVDTVDEQVEAADLGWRTFRVRASVTEALGHHEIVCPASAEAGHLTTCAACRLCNGVDYEAEGLYGDRRKNITIIAHGSRAVKFGVQALPFEEELVTWP